MWVFNKLFFIFFYFCIIFGAEIAFSEEKNLVSKIRFSNNDNGIRIVIDVDNKFKYEIRPLKSPPRIVVDLHNVAFDNNFSFPNPVGIVKGIRFANYSSEISRIVFDLSDSGNIQNRRTIKQSSGSKRKLSFDIVLEDKISGNELKKASSKRNYTKRKTIILDPGHGGKDPGTSYPREVSEKDIVLRFARILKKNLSRNKNYRIYLTREDDRFVSLKDRVDFAKSKNANLFISIHADASSIKSTKGFSVYTLSNKGIDKEAEKLAAIENSYVPSKVKYQGNYLKNALNPRDFYDFKKKLSQAQDDSYVFAGILIDRVEKKSALLKNPNRYAGFAVLKSTDFPSVLVELGFVTNDYDRKNLRSINWLSGISYQFVDAINTYF